MRCKHKRLAEHCPHCREEASVPPSCSAVDHPKHYNAHPSGVECITVVEHMGFNLGNAVKYIWRADEKGAAIKDLEKARWYIAREIERRNKLNSSLTQPGPSNT